LGGGCKEGTKNNKKKSIKEKCWFGVSLQTGDGIIEENKEKSRLGVNKKNLKGALSWGRGG